MMYQYLLILFCVGLSLFIGGCSASSAETLAPIIDTNGVDTFAMDRIKGVSLEMPGNKIGLEPFERIG
ncbi:MAG: hypothetical protein MK066_11625, partial [Crocinitomicaceae bacterium]|nr:hypothetical protein [Crocinitomicaceae bacterium]